MTNQEAMKLALEALKTAEDFDIDADDGYYLKAIKALEEALANQEGQSNFCPQCEALAGELKAIKQEHGDPLPDFYITEKMADSIYKLKSPDWALCISGNKSPTMHKNIPVFVGYVKTKPVEQEQGEPVAKVCHDLDGHIGWNPNLTELPDEGAELYTTPQQRTWVGLTDEEQITLLKDSDGKTRHWLVWQVEAKLKEKNA